MEQPQPVQQPQIVQQPQPVQPQKPNQFCNKCGAVVYTTYRGKNPILCRNCQSQSGIKPVPITPIQMVPIQQGMQGQLMAVQMVPIQQGRGKNYERNKRRRESVRSQKQSEKEQKAQQNDFSVLANNIEDMREQMEELKKMKSEIESLKNIVEEEERGENNIAEMKVKSNFQMLIDSFSEFNDKNEYNNAEKRKKLVPLIADFLEKTKIHDLTGKMDTVIKIIKRLN